MTRQTLIEWLTLKPFRAFTIQTLEGDVFNVRRRNDLKLPNQTPDMAIVADHLLAHMISMAEIRKIEVI